MVESVLCRTRSVAGQSREKRSLNSPLEPRAALQQDKDEDERKEDVDEDRDSEHDRDQPL